MKNITIKKFALGFGITLLSGFVNAQGLENVIVERYYVTNAADAAGSVGTLPVGSVTYIIFIDMAQGYKFQALYGQNAPLHTLSFSTTTTFFNNEDRGATTPAYTKSQAANNSVMLDSWFSVGGAATNAMGIPKADDNGVANVTNLNGILQNNDASAGIPLTTQDGFITGNAGAPQAVTFVGLTNGTTTTDLSVFDGTSQAGNLFTTTNGSVASLNGSVGADTVANKVLVGQFTTDGVFCFLLNIQIGTPTHGVENYVAQNATGNEIQSPLLSFCSNTVSVTNPLSAIHTVSVYPNPATDFITLDIINSAKTDANSYKIFDVVGNIIAERNIGMLSGSYSEKLDISNYSKGIYFVELIQDGVKSTKKIVKY